MDIMKFLVLLCLLLCIPLSVLASVNVLSGNLSHQQNLFITQGGSMPMQMTLQYNSLDKISGQIGVGWSHSFEIYLHENSDGALVMTGGVAKRFYFPDDNSGYVARSGDHSTLTANSDGSYSINFPDGSSYQFGNNKKLSSLTDRHGNFLNLDYSVADQLTVTDSTGRQAVIHYDVNSRVDWIHDPAGAQFDLTYNTNGQMETISYPEPQPGAGRPLYIFNYTATGLLEYITDPNQQISKYVYNQGRVIRTVAPEGVLDTNGREVANATVYSKSYAYSSETTLSRSLSFNTNTLPQTTIIANDGGQWVYLYKINEGQLAAKQDPLGNLTEYSYYPSGDGNYGHRQSTLKPMSKETVGTNTLVSYRLTQYNSYDTDGNPLDIATRIRKISYETNGNPTTIVDAPIHQHLTYTYGSYNRPTSITDQIAGTTISINYAPQGDGSEIVTLTAPRINAADSSGPQTVLNYRSDGQLDSITDPLNRQINYNYTATGQLDSITDPNNIVSGFSDFDALGLAQTVTLTGNNGTSTRITSLQYDALAQLIKTTQGSTTPLITEFDYDGVGNRNSVLDAEQNQTSFDYDSQGQVTRITSFLNPGTVEEQQLDTQLNYQNSNCPSCSGGLDNLSTLTDAKNQITQFNYDPLGRMIKKTDAGNNCLGYTYYTDGRPKQTFEGESETGILLLTYEYTADGKLQTKKDAANNTLASYSYDGNNRLQTATTPDSSSTFSYYQNGWLKSVDNGSYLIEYQYDQLGRRELVNVKQGATILHSIDYVYDATTKELESIVSSQAGTFSFGYDAFHRRATLNYPNGIVGTYSYDDTNQINWLTEIKYTDTGTDILTIGYPQHDRVGNRKQRSEDGTITDYSYDDLYRITQAKTGSSEENFTYDLVGNRESGPTVKDTPEVSYDHNAVNQMEKGRKFTYAYDNRGNQAHRYLNVAQTKYWQYNWTSENQLQQAQLIRDGQIIRTVTNKYDAFGRRIEKQVSQARITTTTTYLYDGEDIVLQQIDDGTTTTISHYLHGSGIDEPLAQIRESQVSCYHADGLGSVVAMTDTSKNIVQRYSYDTFGMLTAIQNPEFTNSYTYTGREWDKELGLYYYRARYYDPMEGRFISRDPIGFAGGDVNLYGYVLNDPVSFVDPMGLWTYYKRWGGPNHTAGRKGSWDTFSEAFRKDIQRQIDEGWDPASPYAPKDAQDTCYMHHDICYGECRMRCANDSCSDGCIRKGLNECDRALKSCLINIGLSGKLLDEARKIAAIVVFELQPANRDAIVENRRTGQIGCSGGI